MHVQKRSATREKSTETLRACKEKVVFPPKPPEALHQCFANDDYEALQLCSADCAYVALRPCSADAVSVALRYCFANVASVALRYCFSNGEYLLLSEL